MPKVRISHLQFFTLLCNLVFGKSLGFTSGAMARLVGRDAWLSMLIAFTAGFLLISLTVWLANRFGAESPVIYLPRLAGRPLGAIFLLLLATFFFGAFITSAITIELHISDYLMTETPLVIFVVLYTLAAAYGVHLGLEVIGRLSVVGLLFSWTIDLLMIMGSVIHMHVNRLLPLFDSGVLPTATASLIALPDVTMATASALFLLPHLSSRKGWMKLCWWSLFGGLLLVIVWPIFEITTLGPEVTGQYLIACMQMARAAELSIYLHRYELIMVIVFVYGVLAQSMVSLFGALELTNAALPFKVRRPVLVFVGAVLTIPLQYYLAIDRQRYAHFIAHVWPAIAIPLAVGVPLLLGLIALLRPSVRGTRGKDGEGDGPRPPESRPRPPAWNPPT